MSWQPVEGVAVVLCATPPALLGTGPMQLLKVAGVHHLQAVAAVRRGHRHRCTAVEAATPRCPEMDQ